MMADRVTEEVDALRLRFPSISCAALGGGPERLVVVPDYPCPGWSKLVCRVAVRVPVQYPEQRLDLIYIDPDVAPASGGAVPRTMTAVDLNEQQWRQISWHFGGSYDPSRQNLVAFVHSVTSYFAGERV